MVRYGDVTWTNFDLNVRPAVQHAKDLPAVSDTKRRPCSCPVRCAEGAKAAVARVWQQRLPVTVHGVHACLNEQGVLDGASHPEWQSNVYHWYSETKRHPSLTRRGIMRKKLVGPHPVSQGGESDKGWLNIEQIATVEVTSEDPGFPIESAFGFEDGPGWRASQGGEQQIRVIFDNPVSVHRVGLAFAHQAWPTSII